MSEADESLSHPVVEPAFDIHQNNIGIVEHVSGYRERSEHHTSLAVIANQSPQAGYCSNSQA
jgi:hypothetical protein